MEPIAPTMHYFLGIAEIYSRDLFTTVFNTLIKSFVECVNTISKYVIFNFQVRIKSRADTVCSVFLSLRSCFGVYLSYVVISVGVQLLLLSLLLFSHIQRIWLPTRKINSTRWLIPLVVFLGPF